MERKKSGTGRRSTILLVFFLLAGLSLLLYPTVSDWWNSMHQSRAIASYLDDVVELDEASYEALWRQAQDYNAALPRDDTRFIPTEEQSAAYQSALNISGNGIMGYLEIPKISMELPIYHGTGETVLQVAVGHVEGSSLPVGGAGTHCVLSGHRGLPSATLFTDLDQLQEGDTFQIHVLDEVLTYEVDQIHVVEPDDVSLLAISEGEDLCTLVTCTPYGVNSHRLLVRGHRVETQAESGGLLHVVADAVRIDPRLVTPVIGGVLLGVILLWVLIAPFGRRRK